MIMRGALIFGTLGVVGALTLSASAEQPKSTPCGCGSNQLSLPVLCGCPDDYCRKPLPLIRWLTCCVPDDYCRKPCPTPPVLGGCGGCDDYDRKPLPSLCRPMSLANYICGCTSGTCKSMVEQPLQRATVPARVEGNARTAAH